MGTSSPRSQRRTSSRPIAFSLTVIAAITVTAISNIDFLSAAAFTFTTTPTRTKARRSRPTSSSSSSSSISNYHHNLNHHHHQCHLILNSSSPSSSSSSSSSTSTSHTYLQEPNSKPVPQSCPLTLNQIHTLLTKRSQYKARRQYEHADTILKGLNQCGIYVNDKRKEWRGDGRNHFGRTYDNYVRRGGIPSIITDATTTTTRNDDDDDEYDGSGSGGRPVLSEKDIHTVSQMVEDRYYAKRRGEFHISDNYSAILKTRYAVKVDDKNREWMVDVNALSTMEDNVVEDGSVSGGSGGGGGRVIRKKEGEEYHHPYVPSPLAPSDHPTHTMDDDLKVRISQRLNERTDFRKKRKYAMADAIRDEFIELYSVVIDDRTREWKVVVPRDGDGDSDGLEEDDFAREALMSQRSAFVRRGVGSDDDDSGKERKEIRKKDNHIAIAATSPSDVPRATENVPILSKEEESSGTTEEQSVMDLESLTVVELKEQLREAGLRVSGKKADLIVRLKEVQ